MSILTKVRYLIEDSLTTGYDVFTYASSSVFTLSEPNISAVTDVSINDISSGRLYSYNSSTNKVTITTAMSAGDSVQITYSFYNDYSDTEIDNYIRAALSYLSVYNYYTFEIDASDNVYPDITEREEHLIATIASILIRKPMKSIRLPDLTLNYAENLSIDEKISKTIKMFKNSKTGIFDIV